MPNAHRFVPAVEPLDPRITPSAPTARVSLSTTRAQAARSSSSPALSADGRYVAFQSLAQLVAADTNETSDVYLADRALGTVSLVSANATGQALGNSSTPAVSGNGRVVAFQSSSTTLVSGLGGGVTNVYTRNMDTGVITLASRTAAATQPNESSFRPTLSADGRLVAFESLASDIVAGFGGARFAVFVFDGDTGGVAAVSRSPSGGAPNADAFNAAISADGRFVVYQSAASNVVSGFGGGGRTDVFVSDWADGTTAVASVDGTGGAANGGSFAPSISGDGRYVAFESAASDIIAGFGGAVRDVFVRDLVGGTTAVASRDAAGGQANRDADSPVISGNGRYVAFLSDATDVVAGFGGNNLRTAFVWDREGTATTAASKDQTGGPPDAPVIAPLALNRDGKILAFSTAAGDVVAGDTNAATDVFVADRPVRGGFAVGSGAGGVPLVRAFNPDGSERLAFQAYAAAYTGGVFVATGDVTGDGVDDIATSTGPGGSANIRVFDGRTGGLVASFFGYPEAFTGGVNVALGDVNDDGYADIVCGVGVGGGPNVRVFDGRQVLRGNYSLASVADGGALLASFFAYPEAFTGGVRVSAADINGDGFADIVCAVGSGGGPNVRVFDGRTGALLTSFFAYPESFTGGLFVSTGDVNGDGVPDLITGVESGGGPNVRAFDLRNGGTLQSFFAFDPQQASGVRVAAADVDGDGADDFVTGTGVGPASLTRVFGGKDLATVLQPFSPFGTFAGGVNVG